MVLLAAVPLATVLLSAGGCQCLPPSIDRPDGGPSDAGGDAGPPAPACVLSECMPPDAGATCAASCIGESCLAECPGGRTCDVLDSGRCLSCAGSVRCAPASCMPELRCTFTVTGSTCAGLLDNGAQAWITTEADCRGLISTDAGALGSWYELDIGEAVVNIPRLGGTCIAMDLATGAPRTRFYCPVCSFIAFGCD